jgi:diketogulonate reductase-like aldo/keto reductase
MNKNRILSNGVEMPSIGMGTYPLQDEAMVKAVVAATKCGYRAFDTAHAYGNEVSVGNALQEVYRVNGLKRADVFITSKIGEDLDHGIPDGKLFYASTPNEQKDIKGIVSKQLNETLRDLQTDYLDLLLIHWPHPDYFVEVWKALEDEYRTGKVRAIGVSNCRERHLKKLIETGTICPMVNQFEIHPLNTRKELIAYCQQIGIQVEAYSPLLLVLHRKMENPILKSLSLNYNKSIPQIILRWDIQQGVIPIPKSGNPVRLQQNIDIFDFELTDDDMKGIDSLNKNYKGLVESTYCPGY